MQLYAQELGSIYADADLTELSEESYSHLASLDDLQAVSQFIKESISAITNWPNLDHTDNFFSLGMDSFQALMTVRKLKQGLAMPDIAVSTVYTNSSVSDVASTILRLSKQHHTSQEFEERERSVLSRSIRI